MHTDSRVVRLSRRAIVRGAGALIAVSTAPSLGNAEPRVVIDDASRLDPTPVATHLTVRTDTLIDRVIALGGAFYLPYRLHARHDQVRAAYPRFDEFVEQKKKYDPGLLFRNLMWSAYVDA